MSPTGPVPVIFSAGRVQAVEHLTRQVFKVEMTTGTIIVKGETANMVGANRQRANVAFSYDAMRAVASGTQARVLDPMETREWYGLRNSGKIDADGATELKRIYDDAQLKDGFVWVAIKLKEGLFGLDEVTKRGDMGEMVTVAEQLRTPENLERLAGIMAVDLFTANMDRINYARGTPQDRHGGDYFTNVGNILLVRKDDGRILLKGLDTFHYNNHFAYLDNCVTEIRNVPEGGYIWPGEWLNSDRHLERMVQNVASGLNHELLDALVQAGYKSSIIKRFSLRTKHRKTIIGHIKKTRTELRQFCQLRVTKAGGRSEPTAGLTSRMKVMGWSK